jgi:DNA-binding winged helix-turn-helix (wHTH) protein/pimeloyl-ACP methyl ester carboxylesterase
MQTIARLRSNEIGGFTTGDYNLRFEFGDYVVDTERAELRHNEKLIDIEPQVFDVLVYLIRNQDRVVSGDELFDSVWQGRSVSLSTLTTRINAARRAIRDNGADQRLIKTINRKGYRFIGQLKKGEDVDLAHVTLGIKTKSDMEDIQQDIHFCTSGNDVRIAYATAGKGPTLVYVGNWFRHLEDDWNGPVYGHMLKWLASKNQLVSYDMRGVGLSDHDVQEISFDAFVRDMESVVKAVGCDDFALFGFSDGAAISVAYAAKYPSKVKKLILFNGYAKGASVRNSLIDTAKLDATMALIKPGFGPDNPFGRALLTSLFIPDANPEQVQWLENQQIKLKFPENTIRKLEMTRVLDITDLLGLVIAPTLVMHCRNDSLHPFEQGRTLAAGIRGAKLVALEGNNHLLLEQDPDRPKFERELTAFLAA